MVWTSYRPTAKRSPSRLEKLNLMFKCLLLGCCPQPYLKLLIVVLVIAPIMIAPLQSIKAEPASVAPPSINTATVPAAAQSDPLGSPYPIPWNWVMITYANGSSKGVRLHYYRSPSLVSPDGVYAAYSRIQMQSQPELYRSRVSSVMFVENLQTGELQVINATSPLANHPLGLMEVPGVISILTPVGWSKTSDRLLARQFEGLFSSSDASDFAVIWHRQQNRTSTVAPSQTAYNHDISILLGWSQVDPNQVLFRAGNLGDQQWSLWAVAGDGQTVAATDVDQPLVFGKPLNQVWSRSQVAYR